LAHQVGDSRALLFIDKEVMAPIVYVELAIGTAPAAASASEASSSSTLVSHRPISVCSLDKLYALGT
jgi:hypothetical protein